MTGLSPHFHSNMKENTLWAYPSFHFTNQFIMGSKILCYLSNYQIICLMQLCQWRQSYKRLKRKWRELTLLLILMCRKTSMVEWQQSQTIYLQTHLQILTKNPGWLQPSFSCLILHILSSPISTLQIGNLWCIPKASLFIQHIFCVCGKVIWGYKVNIVWQ